MEVIRADDASAVSVLLETPLGANAIVNTPYGECPVLTLAIEEGASEVARCLILSGAELDGIPNPLCVALHHGQEAIVDALLAAGARLALIFDLPEGKSYVFYAAIGVAGGAEGYRLVERLIGPAAAQGVDTQAMLDATAAECVREEDPKALREVVRLGARVTRVELLDEALSQRSPELLRAMLSLSSFSRDALIAAAPNVIWNNDHALANMDVLKSHSVKPTAYGEEALVRGCWFDRGDGRPDDSAYEYLLKEGVPASAQENRPLKGAVLYQAPDWSLAALLVRYGADPSALPRESEALLKEALRTRSN